MYYVIFKGGIIISIEDIDEMIKKYSQSLVEMGLIYGGEVEKDVAMLPNAENESTSEEAMSSSSEAANPSKAPETVAETAKNTSIEVEDVNTDPAVSPPSARFPEGEATSAAAFSAAVFSGAQAYPVANARVVVYRGDNIYAFVTTDGNGKTKTVSLPAFDESNSLESDNPRRSIDYLADVFAEGFIAQKGLLVSAVGGSDILLNVLMIPEEERIG